MQFIFPVKIFLWNVQQSQMSLRVPVYRDEAISRDCHASLAMSDAESVNKLFLGLLQNGKSLIMVGVSGFEPPTSWSQTMRASRCATPRSVNNYNAEKTFDAISLLAVLGLRIAIWRRRRVLENISGY